MKHENHKFCVTYSKSSDKPSKSKIDCAIVTRRVINICALQQRQTKRNKTEQKGAKQSKVWKGNTISILRINFLSFHLKLQFSHRHLRHSTAKPTKTQTILKTQANTQGLKAAQKNCLQSNLVVAVATKYHNNTFCL
jgi:hypothetical protein